MTAEHPILFSGEMVRAILEGRKTQTRRIVNPSIVEKCLPQYVQMDAIKHSRWKKAEHLWVRERFGPCRGTGDVHPIPIDTAKYVCFPDGSQKFKRGDYYEHPKKYSELFKEEWPAKWRWRPSIHMPRWASRIELEITNVRIERIQAISEADALAEGFDRATCARVFDKAAAKHQVEYCRWIEDDKRAESDPECRNFCPDCAEKAAKKAGKNWIVCGSNSAEESDGPAMCDKCGKALIMSLTQYGIERELRIEEDPDGKEPEYFPVTGRDARIVHTIADGIGDLRDEHLGRLAQIGFASIWNRINGPKSWRENPWVWVVEFKQIKKASAA